jgi:hypothetical protein
VTNLNKLQRPDLSVKLLGVIWLGKIKMIPHAIVDKVQAYPVPTTVKTAQVIHIIAGYACNSLGVGVDEA